MIILTEKYFYDNIDRKIFFVENSVRDMKHFTQNDLYFSFTNFIPSALCVSVWAVCRIV